MRLNKTYTFMLTACVSALSFVDLGLARDPFCPAITNQLVKDAQARGYTDDNKLTWLVTRSTKGQLIEFGNELKKRNLSVRGEAVAVEPDTGDEPGKLVAAGSGEKLRCSYKVVGIKGSPALGFTYNFVLFTK